MGQLIISVSKRKKEETSSAEKSKIDLPCINSMFLLEMQNIGPT